jgi:hypothetical protein
MRMDAKELLTLDAEIALRLMGHTRRAVRVRGSDETIEIITDNDFYSDGQYTRAELLNVRPRPYSTVIEWAWDVVEKMRQEGWKFCIADGDEEPFQCYFSRPLDDGGVAEPEDEAETAPLAICRAALASARFADRTVKWNKEQSEYLMRKLAAQKACETPTDPPPGAPAPTLSPPAR